MHSCEHTVCAMACAICCYGIVVVTIGIVVVTMTASQFCEAWILGNKGVSLSMQAPRCIVYLQCDGCSHYSKHLPKEGNAADAVVKQAMAGELPPFVAWTAWTPGLPQHAKSTRTRDRLS